MTALLLVAVLLPVAASIVSAFAVEDERAVAVVRLGGLCAAAAWVALLVAGVDDAVAGRLRPDATGAAAAAGSALALAAATSGIHRRGAALLGVAATAVAAGVVFTTPGGVPAGAPVSVSAWGVVAGLGAAAVFAALAAEHRRPLVAVGTAGAALGAASVALLDHRVHAAVLDAGAGRGLAPGVVACAGAALVAVAGGGTRRPALVYLAPALLLGVRMVPIAGGGRWWVVAVGFAAAGVAAAAVPRMPAPVAVALWALAAACAGTGARPASFLLAAGAVVGACLTRRYGPLAALAGVPGAVALVHDLVRPEPYAWAVGALLALTAAALATREPGPLRVPRAGELPAAAAAVWLVAAPATWGWAGAAGLQPYDEALALTAATGAILLVAAGLRRRPAAGRW